MGVGGQIQAPMALPPGNSPDPPPPVKETERASGSVWNGAYNLVPHGVQTPSHPPCIELLYEIRFFGCLQNSLLELIFGSNSTGKC